MVEIKPLDDQLQFSDYIADDKLQTDSVYQTVTTVDDTTVDTNTVDNRTT